LVLFPKFFAGQQPNDYQDYGDHEQYMYQSAYARQSKEPNRPKYHNNDSNRQQRIRIHSKRLN
jgi:hypothetical protein